MYPAAVLCQCPLCFLAMSPCTHSQQSPLSCALTKPCRNKRAKLLKRKQSSLCDHLLCPFLQSSSLRDKKPSACRQKSAALVLPPSLRPSQPRKAKISPSGLLLICPLRLCCRAELSGMACVGLFKECQPQ